MMKSIDVVEHCNMFRGETAYVIGAGPSVSNLDLSRLRGKLIFTVNGATLLQERYQLAPKYFCTTDARFLQAPDTRELATSRVHYDAVRLIRDVIRPYDDSNLRGRTIFARTIGKNGFSKNFSDGFHFWSTSISLAVQMAWYTGVDRLVLLGVDLNYGAKMPRFYLEKNIQPIDPFVSVQIANIKGAARIFEDAGRRLISCSEESMLRPYVEYQPFGNVVG